MMRCLRFLDEMMLAHFALSPEVSAEDCIFCHMRAFHSSCFGVSP